MFKDLLNSIEEKYNNIKEENNNLNNLLKTTTTLKNLFPIPNNVTEVSLFRVSFITNECPDINTDRAKIIANLIPINETYLTALYAKELLTNQEYFIIPTNKYLWFINTKSYGAYKYNNINCTIIKNNLMSKTILLNNILFEINGSNNIIDNLLNIIQNEEYREKKINEKTTYLCGIIPIYQQINEIESGISIDKNNTIVFHSKEKNYKCNINDIDNYEILLDNQVYTSKNITSTTSIGSFQNSCYQINLRITLKDNTIISIPILEQNTFGTKYNSHETTFKKNIEFAQKIIDKIKELSPKY